MQEGVYAQDGQHGQEDLGAVGRIGRGQGLRFLDGGQLDGAVHDHDGAQVRLQRLERLAADVDGAVEPGVPVIHDDEQGDGGDGGQAQGQDDLEQHREVVRAVDEGGFLKGVRQCLDEVHHQNDVVCADRTGQDERPEAVDQAHLADHNVGGDHAAVEDHGDHEVWHDVLAGREGRLPLRQRIGGQHGEHDADGPAHDGAQDRHAIGAEELRITHDDGVIFRGEALGPQRDVAGHDLVLVGKRQRQNVNHGHEADDAHGDAKHIVERYERLAGGRRFDGVFTDGHERCTSSEHVIAAELVGGLVADHDQNTGKDALEQAGC